LHAGWEAVLSAVGYTGHARSCASDVRSRVKRSLSVERDQSLRTVDGLSSHQRIGAGNRQRRRRAVYLSTQVTVRRFNFSIKFLKQK